MKNRISFILCLCYALTVLSGCSSGEAAPSEITVLDAGGHSLSESGVPQQGAPLVPEEDENAPVSPSEDSPVGIPEETDIDDSPLIEENETETETTSSIAATSASPITTTSTSAKPAEENSVPDKPAEDSPVTTTTTKPSETTEATTTTVNSTLQNVSEPIELPAVSIGTNSYTALNYSTVKGVWISYIELAELLTGKSESAFRKALGAAYDNCVALGLNTVYVHVRSHGDAYYNSDLFPWSKYVTGTFGAAPDFDPLEVMIEEAHARSLSFQAWINPLRCCGTGEISGAKGTAINTWANGGSTAGKYIVSVNGTYYLNPAYGDVIDYIAQGAGEIAANYDVDGLHIDDYFYPTTDASFDSAAYNASTFDSLSAFRFANCDKLVAALYSSVKAANPTAVFGVSCQGSMENNYNQMYADVKKWCSNGGYVDYIMPQIYYGFDNSAQPYKSCTSVWDEAARSGGIKLIVGLSASKIGLEDKWAGAGKNEWIYDENILSRQLEYAEGMSAYGGVCLYSYRSIFAPENSVKDKVDREIAAFKTALND